MTADQKACREALSLLFPEGAVVELRALGDAGVHSGYFTDRDKLTDQARILDAFSDVHGVYVTLNEVNPALLSRRANRVKQRLSRSDATTADADITRRRWLPVDLDPVRPSGVSATEDEHIAAFDRAREIAVWLTEKGFPAPVLADSGNGAHLLYRVDLPNDDGAARLVKACLGVLDAFFSDATVHCDTANFNAARIWKCYGTTACKGDHTPERPHRQAKIITAPKAPEIVPETTLRELAALLPRPATAASATATPTGTSGPKGAALDLRQWLDRHGIAVKSERPWQGGTLYTLAECPFSSAHTDGAFAIQFGNGAIFAGCHHTSCGGGAQRWQELRAMYEPERAAGKAHTRTESSGPTMTREKKKEQQVPSGTPPKPAPSEAPGLQEHRKRALDILETGDPLAFLLDVFHRDHVGDRTVAECLAMSVASQSVANTRGLHVAISGNSGKGKTHACNAMLRLLPEAYRLKGTISDKALFYDDDLLPGTVILFDDVSLSDDMQELLKSATANFQEPVIHRTLTRDRQLRVCSIPERCIWWLAKVEAVGDDQVMNRMLSVWIDDSSAQDEAVLDHLKDVEAGIIPERGEDPDVLVCQAIWEVLKGIVRRVRIPYARRINFSAAHNRRNPAMLFDLIKCHAVLHVFQRETDGDGVVIATRDDFDYARRLYLALNGDVGGQETKLTRNEAAALTTLIRLDMQIFTIRQLQDALGFSYYQTYRLIHGYSNSRTTYLGILDKCPAISPIDATIAEEIDGVECRKREHYFSFDRVLYRVWSVQTDVWLAEETDDDDRGNDEDGGGGPDDGDGGPSRCTPAPRLHQKSGDGASEKEGSSSLHFVQEGEREERSTESIGSLHTEEGTDPRPVPSVSGGAPVCDPGAGAKETPVLAVVRPFENPGSGGQNLRCKHGCNTGGGPAKVQPHRQAGGIIPLPGVLDHTTFRRSSVCLGNCAICGKGAAVYQSKEQRTAICEACYARLVREWNRSEGVA